MNSFGDSTLALFLVILVILIALYPKESGKIVREFYLNSSSKNND